MAFLLDTPLRRLVEYWRAQGLQLAESPAPTEDVSRFERENSLTLPAAFRRYLLQVNGMNFLQWPECHDKDGFYFWPLETIERQKMGLTPQQIECLGGPGLAATRIVFADYFQWSWAFALGSTGGSEQGAVFMVGKADSPIRIANSLDAFIDLYVSRAPILRGE